jgi:hypothetical protein
VLLENADGCPATPQTCAAPGTPDFRHEQGVLLLAIWPLTI